MRVIRVYAIGMKKLAWLLPLVAGLGLASCASGQYRECCDNNGCHPCSAYVDPGIMVCTPGPNGLTVCQ